MSVVDFVALLCVVASALGKPPRLEVWGIPRFERIVVTLDLLRWVGPHRHRIMGVTPAYRLGVGPISIIAGDP